MPHGEDLKQSGDSHFESRYSFALFLTFIVAAVIAGVLVEGSAIFRRAELQTVNQRFDVRRWLQWAPAGIDRLAPEKLWQYHEAHEIPKTWWAWDYTLSWLTADNHPPVKQKIVIFNHLIEDEPPPEAIETFPWMRPLLRHPVSRATVAEVIRYLAQSNVRMIVLDNDFPQFSEDDRTLAQAIHAASSGDLSGHPVPVLMARTVNRSASSNLLKVEVPTTPSGVLSELQKLEPQRNVLEKYTGITGVWQDEDQVVRSLASRIHGAEGRVHESIVVKGMKALGESVPQDLPASMNIDFAGPPNSELYPVRPFSYLLDPEKRSQMRTAAPLSNDVTLAGAIVLLGDGVVDVFNTPTTNQGYNMMSGAEVMAHALDTVKRHSWQQRLSRFQSVLWIAANSVVAALLLVSWRLAGVRRALRVVPRSAQVRRLVSDVICLAVCVAGSYLLACLMFVGFGLIVPVISPIVAIVFGTVAAVLWEREREQMDAMGARINAAEERLQMSQELHKAELEAQAAHAQAREVLIDRERRREFLRKINHDLRAPVSVLNWTITRLKKEGLGASAASEKLDRIANSSDRLTGLLDELMQTYDDRESDDDTEPSTTPSCDLNEVAGNCCNLEKSLAEQRGSHLEFVPAAEPAMINARTLEISRSIDNIIRNGLLHNDAGCRVKVKVEPGAVIHKLTVSDDGHGIAPDSLSHIFEAGFSSRSYEDGNQNKHQGLGLHIVKTFIEGMGGSISVNSEASKGTTFSILLPAAGRANQLSRTSDTHEQSALDKLQEPA